jgi:hypothetical protein
MMALKAQLAQMAHKALTEHKARLVQMVLKARLVMMEHKALQVLKVL